MSAHRRPPALAAFPAAACPDSVPLLYVNAEAPFRDLWEEAVARTTYVRDLADVFAQCVDDMPEGAARAFANVAYHLLAESQVFETLACAAAARETGRGPSGKT